MQNSKSDSFQILVAETAEIKKKLKKATNWNILLTRTVVLKEISVLVYQNQELK